MRWLPLRCVWFAGRCGNQVLTQLPRFDLRNKVLQLGPPCTLTIRAASSIAEEAEAQLALRRRDKHGSKQRALVNARAVHMDNTYGSFSVVLNVTRCANVKTRISPSLEAYMAGWPQAQQQQLQAKLQDVALALAESVKAQQSAQQPLPLGSQQQPDGGTQGCAGTDTLQSEACAEHRLPSSGGQPEAAVTAGGRATAAAQAGAGNSVRPRRAVQRPIPSIASIVNSINQVSGAMALEGYNRQQLHGFLISTNYAQPIPTGCVRQLLTSLVVSHAKTLPGKCCLAGVIHGVACLAGLNTSKRLTLRLQSFRACLAAAFQADTLKHQKGLNR